MISPAARERFFREERGFTLTEILVTMMLMIIVLSALYSVLDMSLRVFSSGNNKVEAVESARVGLEKMAREIRAAYPVDIDATDTYVLFFSADGSPSNPSQQMPTATQITFGNERGDEGAGDRKIDCPNPDDCEYITYKLTDDTDPLVECEEAPCTLRRVNTANSEDEGDPVVENVDPGGPNNGIIFQYLTSDGDTAVTEDQIAMVLVSLDIRVDNGIYNAEPPEQTLTKQTLTTIVDLRNR